MILTDLARHPGRYRDIARLLVKYGRSDLVRRAGLDATLAEELAAEDGADGASRAQGDELAADLERLGPTFIKLGQLLSTRADLLPAPYLDGLSRLQDSLEPFGFDAARNIIEDELGVRLSRLFVDFEEKPLAAASLGQVHAATLRGDRPVVVKVQRPGVRRQVFDDLEVLETVAQELQEHTEQGRQLGVSDLLARFHRSLVDELDYRKEAANLLRLREIVSGRHRLVVPAPYEDFSSGRVLTMDRIPGRKVTEVSPLARLDVDGPGLARELFEAYLDQLLVEGFFHADPHPGNVLLTPDGRLGLIDLGMVGRLTPQVRERVIRLLLALGEGRGEEVARVAAELSQPGPDYDAQRFATAVSELVERQAVTSIGHLDTGRLVLDLTRACAGAGMRPPPELSMAGKTLLNLDLVARILDPDVEPVAIVRERALGLAQGGMTPSLSGLLSAAMEARDFAEQLPGRVNRAMDALSGGTFEVRVNAFDDKAFLQGLHRMANRVATGLVLASLIIGAALLSNAPASTRIGGYPAVAFVLFLVAVVGGAALVVSIVLSDRRIRRRR